MAEGKNIGVQTRNNEQRRIDSCFMCYGDVIALHCTQKKGFLRSSSFRAEGLRVEPAESISTAPPGYEECLFRVHQTFSYSAQNEMVQLTAPHIENPGIEINAVKTMCEELLDDVRTEHLVNLAVDRQRRGTRVRYGERVQLKHCLSGRFLTLVHYPPADDRRYLKVVLEEQGSQDSWLMVKPRFKVRQEKDAVEVNDELLLQFKNGNTLQCSTATMDTHSDYAFARYLEVNAATNHHMTWKPTIFAKHDDLGVNLPLDKPGLPAALMVAGHGASATALVPVQCGNLIHLVHCESGQLLHCREDYKVVTVDGDGGQRAHLVLSLRPRQSHNRDNTVEDSNFLWVLEKEESTKGGSASWGERFRLKHFNTLLLLSMGETDADHPNVKSELRVNFRGQNDGAEAKTESVAAGVVGVECAGNVSVTLTPKRSDSTVFRLVPTSIEDSGNFDFEKGRKVSQRRGLSLVFSRGSSYREQLGWLCPKNCDVTSDMSDGSQRHEGAFRFAAAVDESQLERVVLAQGLVQRIKDIVHSKEAKKLVGVRVAAVINPLREMVMYCLDRDRTPNLFVPSNASHERKLRAILKTERHYTSQECQNLLSDVGGIEAALSLAQYYCRRYGALRKTFASPMEVSWVKLLCKISFFLIETICIYNPKTQEYAGQYIDDIFKLDEFIPEMDTVVIGCLFVIMDGNLRMLHAITPAQVKDLLQRIKANDQPRFLRFLTSICYQRSFHGSHHKLVIRRNQSLVSDIIFKDFVQTIMPLRLMPKGAMPHGDQLPYRYNAWPDTFAREVANVYRRMWQHGDHEDDEVQAQVMGKRLMLQHKYWDDQFELTGAKARVPQLVLMVRWNVPVQRPQLEQLAHFQVHKDGGCWMPLQLVYEYAEWFPEYEKDLGPTPGDKLKQECKKVTTYFERMSQLLTVLCKERNYTAISRLRASFPYEVLLAGAAHEHLYFDVRSFMLDMMESLWVDAAPHIKSNEREPVRVFDPSLSPLEQDEEHLYIGAESAAETSIDAGRMHDDELLLMDNTPGSAKFALLQAMIELQLPEHDTVVERDLQKFCLRQTTLTQRLILFGFYPSAHHIQKLVVKIFNSLHIDARQERNPEKQYSKKSLGSRRFSSSDMPHTPRTPRSNSRIELTRQKSMRKYHAKMPASAISLIADWVANRKSDSVDTLVKKLHSDPESKQHKHQQAHAIDSVDQESEKMSLRQVLEGNQRRAKIAKLLDSTAYSVYMTALIALNMLLVLLVFLSSQGVITDAIYRYQLGGAGGVWNMIEIIFILGYIADSAMRIYVITSTRLWTSLLVLSEGILSIIACVLYLFPDLVALRFVLVLRLWRAFVFFCEKIRARFRTDNDARVKGKARLGALTLSSTTELLQLQSSDPADDDDKMLIRYEFNYHTRWLMEAKLAQLRLLQLITYKAQDQQLTELLFGFQSQHLTQANEFYEFQDTDYDFSMILAQKGKFHRILADLMLCKFKPLMRLATSMFVDAFRYHEQVLKHCEKCVVLRGPGVHVYNRAKKHVHSAIHEMEALELWHGRTDATAIEKKTTLLKRFQYLSRLLMRFHDMGSTEAQLLQGTYYSFGVATLLDEVMRIGVDTLTEDKLVIDIFAEFNNFLAALVCRNPMLQGKVSKYIPQFVKRISKVPNSLTVLTSLFWSNMSLCRNLSKHLFQKIVGQVHLLREHDSRAGDVETKSDATAEASHEGVVTDVPPVALLEFFHRIVLVDKVPLPKQQKRVMKVLTSQSAWLAAKNWVFCTWEGVDRSGCREELMARDDWSTQPAMKYHLMTLRLLTTCCKGNNRVTVVQCQNLCPLKDLVKAAVSKHTIWNVKLSLIFLIFKIYVKSSIKLGNLANSNEMESLLRMFARNITMLKSGKNLYGRRKNAPKLPGMSTQSLYTLIGKYSIDDPLFLQSEPHAIQHSEIGNFRIYLLNFVGTHVLPFTYAMCTLFRHDFRERSEQFVVLLKDALEDFLDACKSRRRKGPKMTNTARTSFMRRLRQTISAMNDLPILHRGGDMSSSALHVALHRHRTASGTGVQLVDMKLQKLEMKHPAMRGKKRNAGRSKVGSFQAQHHTNAKKVEENNDDSEDDENFDDMSDIDVDSCKLTLGFQSFVKSIRTSDHIRKIIQMEISSAVKFLLTLNYLDAKNESKHTEDKTQHKVLSLVLNRIVAYIVESHRRKLDINTEGELGSHATNTGKGSASSSIKMSEAAHEQDTSQKISVQLCRILVALLKDKSFMNTFQHPDKPDILTLNSDNSRQQNLAGSPPTRTGAPERPRRGGAIASVLYMHQLLSRCGVLEMALELFSPISAPELRFQAMTLAVLMLDVKQHFLPENSSTSPDPLAQHQANTFMLTTKRTFLSSTLRRSLHPPTPAILPRTPSHIVAHKVSKALDVAPEELPQIVERVTSLMRKQAFRYLDTQRSELQQQQHISLSDSRPHSVSQAEVTSQTTQEFLSGMAEELDAGIRVLKAVRFKTTEALPDMLAAATLLKKSLFETTAKTHTNSRGLSRRLSGMDEMTEEEQQRLPLAKRLSSLLMTIKFLKLLGSHATALNNSWGYIVLQKLVECFGNTINSLKESVTKDIDHAEKEAMLLHLSVELCDVLQKVLTRSHPIKDFLLLQTNILQIIKSHIRNQGWHNIKLVTEVTPHPHLMLEKSIYLLLMSLSRRVSVERTVDKKIINVLSFPHLLSRLELMLKEIKVAPSRAQKERVMTEALEKPGTGGKHSRITPLKTTGESPPGRPRAWSSKMSKMLLQITAGNIRSHLGLPEGDVEPSAQEDLELAGCTLSSFLFYMRDRNPQWWHTSIVGATNYTAVKKFDQRMASVEIVDASKHMFRIYFVNPKLISITEAAVHEGLAKMSRIDHTERLSEFLDVCEELYGQEEWERFLTDKRLDRVCSGKILKYVHRAGTQLTWAINIVLLVCWQYNRVPHMPVFQNTDVEDFRLTLRIPDMLRQAAFLKDDVVSEMIITAIFALLSFAQLVCFTVYFIEYLVVIFPHYWRRRLEEAKQAKRKMDILQTLMTLDVITPFLLLVLSVIGFAGDFNGWYFLYGAFSIQLPLLALTRWSVMRLLVLPALTKSCGQMLQVMSFVGVLSFFFAAILFTVYPTDFVSPETSCETYAECIAMISYHGIIQGGGIAEKFKSPDAAARVSTYSYGFHYVSRLAFDLLYWVVVPLLAFNMLLGIVIDTFSIIKDEREDHIRRTHEICSICGLSLSLFEAEGITGTDHLKHEHSPWSYFKFFVYLSDGNVGEHDHLEKYVQTCLATKKTEVSWFPNKRALSLSWVKEEEEELSESVQRQLSSMTEDLAVVKVSQQNMQTQLCGLENHLGRDRNDEE